ncbi:MAG: 50S ribosomal protein L11 [Rickettsiales bacterium]|nr:50S ribosomal protein L11 [Rickettsiales bacterium]
MGKGKKAILGYVKLEIPAGKANPAPPVGTALGPRGVNLMEFCKAFNDKTKSMEAGSPVPVIVTVYQDRSFTFVTKTPPTSYFLKKSAKVKKGSSETKKSPYVGSVTKAQILEIVKAKQQDLNAYDEEAAAKMIIGSAQSMGIQVKG